MDIDDATLDAMERYGGSFATQLAVLYRLADPQHRATLARAFAVLFAEYAGLAALAAARDRTR